jgi:hypothetical protein
MTPSIEVRLTSVLHGLRDVIIPTINPGEALAVEQSGLILAQLSMLLKQLPFADRYHRLCRDDARTAAASFVQGATGGPHSLSAAKALAALLDGAEANDPHANYLALADGIAALTTAVAEDGEPGWRARSLRSSRLLRPTESARARLVQGCRVRSQPRRIARLSLAMCNGARPLRNLINIRTIPAPRRDVGCHSARKSHRLYDPS